MDFAPDETQDEVRGLCARVLDRETGERGDPGYDDAAWKAMGEAGLTALAVPERLGGDGLGLLEVAAVLTEVGRRAAAVPAFAALALGVLPVVRYGTPDQQDELLPVVAAHGGVLTAAQSEPSDPLPSEPRTAARLDGAEYVLSGTKVGVPFAGTAHRVLVTATLRDGPGVLVVDPTADGVSLVPTRSSGGAPEATVRLHDVRVPAAALLGDGAVTGLRRFALAGACALGDGVLAGALDLTVAHVGTRHQFGKPLSAFQAVAGQVADVYVAARTLHLAALAACWRLSTGRDADLDLDTAAHWLAGEALVAVHTCHHLHGGLGVDITHPMHRFYGLAKDLTRFVGGAEHRLDLLARHEEEPGVR
ncbi:acyl-CoA dehydrogenase family protein [Umezawaea sp.]|uniref:acyl-CoA dehydrogenase family protein n=1 Tax=Umezawaea sp. TaxID=1955258 RepID=UPI002ED5FC33